MAFRSFAPKPPSMRPTTPRFPRIQMPNADGRMKASGFKPAMAPPETPPSMAPQGGDQDAPQGKAANFWGIQPKAPDPKAEAELKYKQLQNEALEDKQTHKDIMYKTITGMFGSPHGEKDYNGILDSSTTGYQDPAARALTKRGMDPETMAEVIKHNVEAKPEKPPKEPVDNTEQAIAWASHFKPGSTDDKGNPITFDRIARDAVSNPHFKNVDMSDPRWKQLEDAYNAKQPESPGIMDNFLSRMKGAGQSVIKSLGDVMPGTKASASAMPGTPPPQEDGDQGGSSAPAPGMSRVYKAPTPDDHQAALDWATANPNDSRSAVIRQKAQSALQGE